MKNQHQVAVIGVGSLGTSLAWLLSHNQHQINVFDFKSESLQIFQNNPLIKKQKNIHIHQDFQSCLKNSNIILPCLPSQYINIFYENKQLEINQKSKFISITKGFWPNTYQTISEKLSEKINRNQIMVMCGPTFADEIMNQNPTTAVIGTTYQPNIKIATELFNNNFFSIQHNSKPVAVELGGILKNCYAITLGLLTQSKLGMNTKALCVHKILQETKDLFQSLNLPQKSVYSPSFLGDLIATGFNSNSRNFQYGLTLSKNKNNTIEGAENIHPVLKRAARTLTPMPILKTTWQIINQEKEIDSLTSCLSQSKRRNA